MSDTTTAAPADATALPPNTLAPSPAPADQSAAAAEAAPSTALSDLESRKNAALALLDVLKDEIEESFEKAKTTPGWIDATHAFLEDVEVKAKGVIAWIERHV